MKKNLLKILVFLFSANSFAQAPQIEGDLLLCPWTEGTATITTNQTYDSYQWFYKYWFLSDDYQAIDGATEASFTYDWYTYDQALLKVVVTLNGETYESNTIQIDSWNWVGLVVFNEMNENVTFDPDNETFLLCQGATFELSINNPPYNANIRWYRDETPIVGANTSTYIVTEPGVYYVEASPDFCPDSSNNSMPITVAWDPNCNLSVDNPIANNNIKIYPNPVQNQLTIQIDSASFENYKIVDFTGKTIANGKISGTENVISLDSLSKGMYILQLISENQIYNHKIIKE